MQMDQDDVDFRGGGDLGCDRRMHARDVIGRQRMIECDFRLFAASERALCKGFGDTGGVV
jgi:hypothetical protein